MFRSFSEMETRGRLRSQRTQTLTKLVFSLRGDKAADVPQTRLLLLTTAGTEGREVARSPFVNGMTLLTTPGENTDTAFNICLYFYLLILVSASAHRHVLQCE